MVTARHRLTPLLLLGIFLTTHQATADEPRPLADETPAPAGGVLLERAWQARTAGHPEEAEADLRAALAQFEEVGDPRGARIALANLGMVLAELERVDEAVAILRRAVDLADDAVDRSAPVATRVLLADVLVDAHRPLEALAWADAALVAAVAVGHAEYFPAPIATYLRTTRAVDASPATLLAATEHVEGRLEGETGYEGSQTIPQLVFSHGVSELGSGEIRSALDAMDVAVAVADALGDTSDLSTLLAGLGFVALQAGDEERARIALERGLAIEPDVPLLAALALVEWRQGWSERAIQRYTEALDLLQQQDIGDETTELRIALADQYAVTGALDMARRLHEQALDELVRAGGDGATLVQRARLARLDARLGRWAEARRQAERSLSANRDPFERPGESPSYLVPQAAADALQVLAAVYWERDEPQDAEAALVQALEILDALGAERSVAAAALGHIALLQGDPERALERFGQPDGDRPDWRLAHGRGVALWRMGELVAAEDALRESLTAAQREPLDQTSGWVPFVATPRSIRADLVALLLQQHREQEALAVVLAEEGRSVAALRSQLGPSRAGLVYGAASAEGVLFVVTEGDLASFQLGRSMVEIERQVLDYARDVATRPVAGRHPSEAWIEPSRALYDLLLEPAAGILSGTEELVVVPHGVIARVPFATLLDEDQPLAARYRLAMAGPPGTADGRVLPRRPDVSVLSPQEDGGMAESDAIRASYRRATEVEPRTATQVLVQLRTAQLVHLALVVEPNSLQPERTVLLASAEPGGRLTVGEIGGSEVGAFLVVLTGCLPGPSLGLATDLASMRPRPALTALSGALIEAGAARVVASQWLAEPQDRAELLREFYRDLGRHGPAESLRRAQVRMAESDVHPYYWGGWVVFSGGGDSAL